MLQEHHPVHETAKAVEQLLPMQLAALKEALEHEKTCRWQ